MVHEVVVAGMTLQDRKRSEKKGHDQNSAKSPEGKWKPLQDFTSKKRGLIIVAL